jgi:hypothetical protein
MQCNAFCAASMAGLYHVIDAAPRRRKQCPRHFGHDGGAAKYKCHAKAFPGTANGPKKSSNYRILKIMILIIQNTVNYF